MNNQPRAPLSKLCGLWQNTSKTSGKVYLAGRIGDLKVLIFENRDHEEGDSEPTHVLLVQHSPKSDRRAPSKNKNRARLDDTASAPRPSSGDEPPPWSDEDMPF